MTWPALPLEPWWDTQKTLHRWMQVVGKIRMTLTPLVNHWWNVTFYLTARGLTTSEIPYGERSFDMEFDFVDHLLRIRVRNGQHRQVELAPRSVADFYREVFAALHELKIECEIWPVPVEIEDPIPLDRDEQHKSYEREPVERFWHILSLAHGVFSTFRGDFIGKCSPVHFFWGSFDLAVTRFSGKRAPERAATDSITSEAYSHEVSSAGFWPGDSRLPLPSFYSYAAPEPEGFRKMRVVPAQSYYNEPLNGFYLHYDTVRTMDDPAGALLDFCRSTYEAAAIAGRWDRDELERPATAGVPASAARQPEHQN